MTGKPLAGITVVDLSRHLPGPLAAHLLADLGARVIKVEEPSSGDPVRLAPPLADRSVNGGEGTLAALLLSGVESVALDLKAPGGREVLERLLAKADVLLETFRPGTLARFGTRPGFDPEELRRRHPRLVVCSLSGWGADGPYAPRAGHDLTYQAIAGALAPSGTTPDYPAADFAGAWSAVTSILAALVARERAGADGNGAWIDASLYDAALHLNLVGWAHLSDRSGGGADRPVGERHGLSGALPCYRVYTTADGGRLAVAALEEHFWRRFCEAAGRPDLLKIQYREDAETHQRVAEMVAGRTLSQWRELLAEVDVPVGPLLTAAEAAAHPQSEARGLLSRSADGLLRLAFPARFGGERPAASERYPALGEDTDAIVEELGGELAGKSPRQRRKAGIGRRRSWKRALSRWWIARRSSDQ
jgi:crotonobetainyl-CoA:carnitine CoA-transferase CaiB-like acyl-CoA transferase